MVPAPLPANANHTPSEEVVGPSHLAYSSPELGLCRTYSLTEGDLTLAQKELTGRDSSCLACEL